MNSEFTHATKQELGELAGSLAHCSMVISRGNTFNERIYIDYDLCACETLKSSTTEVT